MVDNNIGSLIVMGEGRKATGIMTERDYLEKIIVLGRTSHKTLVKEIMSEKGLISARPTSTLTDCMELMVKNRVRHLPVLESDGRITGLVSIGDVIKELLDAHERTADHMESFIAGGY